MGCTVRRGNKDFIGHSILLVTVEAGYDIPRFISAIVVL